MNLTRRQRECVEFVERWYGEKGWAPYYSEIAEGLGRSSKGSVHALVQSCVARGALAIRFGKVCLPGPDFFILEDRPLSEADPYTREPWPRLLRCVPRRVG